MGTPDLPPGTRTVILREIIRISEKTVEIRMDRPRGFAFHPGQFIRFLDSGMEKDYSLASGPADAFLSILVRRTGRFSNRLAASSPGDAFLMEGPKGYFTFHASRHPAVFVAAGVGIAPFVSMIRSGVADAILLHGVSTREDLCYRDLVRRACRTYIPCISRTGGPPPEKGFYPGRVTRCAAEHLEPGVYDFYLCGRREMIRDMMAVIDDRFSGSRVFTEMFY